MVDGMGRLAPLNVMIAGGTPEPDGMETVTVKEMDLPLAPTLMVRVLPESDAVRVSGLGGRAPSSYVWNSWLSCCWRHGQSAWGTTFLPLANVKGSGNLGSVAATKPEGIASHEAFCLSTRCGM